MRWINMPLSLGSRLYVNAQVSRLAQLSLLPMLILVLCLVTAGPARAAPSAPAVYSCSDKCYGDFPFYHWTGVNGGEVTIDVVHVSCSGCGTLSYVNNTMWVGDDTTGCTNDGACWIEAGYGTFKDPNNPWYYWADMRPGLGYAEHPKEQVPSGDFGNAAQLLIRKSATNTYIISITSPYASITGTSTANSMSGDRVQIGEELQGTTGASAPTARYFNNVYIDTSNNYYVENSTGGYSVVSDNPPYASWAIVPSGTSAAN